MSAFGVIVDWHAPPEQRRGDALLAHLEPFGPDRSGTVGLDRCVLVHAAFDTTPEATRERQPTKHVVRDVWIVGDVRLDNRDELCGALDGSVGHPLDTDVDLLLAGYERWGADVVRHLVGDFAFAVWDADRQALLLARDHLGVRPLVWVVTDEGVVAGSTVRAVLEASGVARVADEDFLSQLLAGDICSSTATVWRDLHRLAPAHRAQLTRGRTRVDRYWSPTMLEQPLGFAEAAEAVRASLEEAVRCRTRSVGPVGVEVSGGFDSSTVFALAAREPDVAVRGVARVFPGLACDESDFIDAMEAFTGVTIDRIDAPSLGAPDPLGDSSRLADLAPMLDQVAMPAVAERVHARSGRVLLTGVGGDQLLGAVPAMHTDLLRRGWIRQAATWAPLTVSGSVGTVSGLSRLAVHTMLGTPGDRRAVQRLVGLPFDVRRRRLVGRRLAHLAPGIVDRALAAPSERLRAPRGVWSSTYEQRFAYLQGAYVAFLLDQVNLAGAGRGLELRHPFYDRRLVELCLSLPQQHILAGEHPRGLHRAVARDLLADSVLERRDKAEFSPWWSDVLGAMFDHGGRQVVQCYAGVDAQRVGEMLHRFATTGPAPDADPWLIWWALAVSAWAEVAGPNS